MKRDRLAGDVTCQRNRQGFGRCFSTNGWREKHGDQDRDAKCSMHIEIRFQMTGESKVWHTQRGKDAHIFTGMKRLLLPELGRSMAGVLIAVLTL